MAEYITKEQAYNSVDERIDELKADKEFNIVKEICISGVKKHISAIPAANVVERSKIDEAILGMEREQNSEFWNSSFRDGVGYALELLKKNLGIGNELNEDRVVEECNLSEFPTGSESDG